MAKTTKKTPNQAVYGGKCSRNCGRNRTRTYGLLWVREAQGLSIKFSTHNGGKTYNYATNLEAKLSSMSTIAILGQDICTRWEPRYEARKGDPQPCFERG